MFEEINENISRLVDGDLGHGESLDLLKKMKSDDVLKCRMSRYQAISQALKTDQFHQVSLDFSRKVFQEIQQEPTYFLPQLKPKIPVNSQPQTQARLPKLKLFAVAASTLAAVVLVGQGIRDDQSGNQYPTLSASAIPQQALPALAQTEQTKQRTRHPLNAQFNDYLQAHNSSIYTNGEASFQSYAKVAAYGRE